MAAYMRGMLCLLSCERKAFLLGASSCRPVVESKRYVRGLRRKPVKVLFPEDDTSNVIKQQSAPKQQREKSEKPTKGTKENAFARQLKSVHTAPNEIHAVPKRDEIDGLRFERANPEDKRLARVVSVARSRKFREQQGKILLEGRRLISDALNAGANPQMVFFSTMERLLELPVDKLKRATLVKVKFEDIKIWSDLVHCLFCDVAAIFARPDTSRLHYNRDYSIPLSLICDNIRDPGNLGTILRCAVAAGCHSVLLTKGCVDAWEPKVLRAAMGAHFRLPLYSNLHWEDIESHLSKSVTVHVADHRWDRLKENSDSDSDYELSLPRVDSRPYFENWAENPTALVIGGETCGLSIESVQLAEKTAGKRLFIPVVPEVDSLNSAMAASILLFEGRRQLMQQLKTTKKVRQK
uniref:Mitochondrial rRNA methyltransferase 3a n=1 Tax=Neogobius melanostomus TaxID=47308 RepID=A0A8C6TJC5_9GOBI